MEMKGIKAFISVVFGGILYHVQGVLGGRDICEVHGTTYSYCDDGYHCCDDNKRCCADGLSSATVIGIVFAALFFISICLFCAILVTKKKKFRPNQLVQPTNQQYTNNISTVGQTNNAYPQLSSQGQNLFMAQNYGTPPYRQSIPYGQTPIQPPPYSQTDVLARPPPPEYKLEP